MNGHQYHGSRYTRGEERPADQQQHQQQRQRRPERPPHEPRDGPKIVKLPDDALLPAALDADGYRLGSTVGHGSYSKVRIALRSLTDDTVVRVACKVINKKRDTGSSYVRKFLPRELEVLCAIRHPHLVTTHRIYVAPSTVHVFMDYCVNGDLLSHMQDVKSMPLWQARMFFKQICDAVAYLHQKNISHRDIKCENVLLENMRHVKLTDFGFARVCTDERGRRLMSQTYCGSMSYAAPEVLQGIPYDPKAYDVWALGVVLYVMLADILPYPHTNRQQIVANQMAKRMANPRKPVSKEALRLITTRRSQKTNRDANQKLHLGKTSEPKSNTLTREKIKQLDEINEKASLTMECQNLGAQL